MLTTPRSESPRRRRRALTALAGLVLVAVLLSVFAFRPHDPGPSAAADGTASPPDGSAPTSTQPSPEQVRAAVEEAGIAPPSFTVDTGLRPATSTVPGMVLGQARRATAAVVDKDGHQADFVEDEATLLTTDPAGLQAFVDRWHGTVVRSLALAELKAGDARTLSVVRIDPQTADARAIGTDLRTIDPGSRGEHRVSSDAGLQLLAAVSHEAANGVQVGLSLVPRNASIAVGSTREAAAAPGVPGYTPDAFSWDYLRDGSIQDAGVPEAWRALTSARREGQVGVAILEAAGFVDNADVPANSVSHSVVPYLSPSDPALAPCGDGSACPFHGTATRATAVGVPDNGFGTAGTAGPFGRAVAEAQLGDPLTLALAFIDASANGARIANLSWGIPLPGSLAFANLPYDVVTGVARAGGMLVFASAGNDGENIDAQDCVGDICWNRTVFTPCGATGVVCVGGLAGGSTERDSGSNFGTRTVRMYAPFTVISSNVDTPTIAASMVSGTSFSSPFVAGVAALVWTANPSLTADQVVAILERTAHPGNAEVIFRIDALEAVVAALGNRPPTVTITDPADGATIPGDARLHAVASDDDGRVPAFMWLIDNQAAGPGADIQPGLSSGRHTINVSATDSGGFVAFDEVVVTVADRAASVHIVDPIAGTTVTAGRPLVVRGTSHDPDLAGPLPDDGVQWTWDDESLPILVGHRGLLATGRLTPGPHVLHFAVAGIGARTIDDQTVTIQVVAPDPTAPPAVDAPTVLITAPGAGANLPSYPDGAGGFGADVHLVADVRDSRGNVPPGAAVHWTATTRDPRGHESTLDLGTGLNVGASLTASTDCQQTFTITATVTDAAGHTAEDHVTVTTGVVC